MSFEYIIEPDVRKTLSNSQKSDIVQKVSSAYDIFNEARQDNLKKANSLIDEIFFKNTFREEKDKTKK